MRNMLRPLIATLLALSAFAGLHCSTGGEPEVVVVPIGEPGSGDPYDTGGDLACGGSTSAQQIGADMVLLSFHGTRDTWLIYLPKAEAQAVIDRLEAEDAIPELGELTPEQVDALHDRFCLGPDSLAGLDRRIYELIADELGARMKEIVVDVCD